METDTVSRERVIVKDMPLPEKTEAEQEQEFKLFVSNFRLIQKYAEFIRVRLHWITHKSHKYRQFR